MTVKGQDTMPTLKTLLGFNGELFEPGSGHCLLGNGYRAYSPVLMIFIQPDSWSPFGAGGLNAYAYCEGDPVNYRDPTGHIKMRFLLPAPPKYFEVPMSAALRVTAQARRSTGGVGSHGRGAFGQSSGLDSPAQASGLSRSQAPLGPDSVSLPGTPPSNSQALHPATSQSSVQQHASAGRMANPGEREVLIPGSSAPVATGPSMPRDNGQGSMPPQPGTSRDSLYVVETMQRVIRREETLNPEAARLLKVLMARLRRKR